MNIERQIEFDVIKEQWKKLAVTDQAKEMITEVTCYLAESDLRKQLRDTTNSKILLEKLGTPPLQNVAEAKEILIIAGKGDCLTPYQLERVEKVLVAVMRLKDYLGRGKQYENPLAYYEENLDAAETLREEISRQIRNGVVEDYASKELRQIRTDIIRCEEQMKQKAEQLMRANKECMADSYCTTRNGRICVPVKKEYKFKISGSVIDKSATGNTFFIEPVSVAKFYEELQMLRISEENEVYRILYTLTAMVAEAIPQMNENIRVMEKLDFIFSKGKLSMDMDAVEPDINTERRIILKDARHPLMDRAINVPLQFEIGRQARGIIITGPNTGGKTVAIKTVMLSCIMAQCGLHVACREADICMNSSYLCDIGDGQNIAENLSTFSAHIKNVLEVLREVSRDSLVIMDEMGSGTDPTEGMGIAVAILEQLRKSNCLFLVTTHYPEVKEYADTTQDIINARMTFDKETLKPTYQMVIGEAGESCAFYIADRLGMPNEMLKTAVKAAYGEAAVRDYRFREVENSVRNQSANKIIKVKKAAPKTDLGAKYHLGDSVMVFPDKKIGIVCEPVNEKG
ncbi:MAG: DNA mismatch repair protein MutS, partial [Lachnospiraceae bacterium]|nr:DNA mismatch repair protein MutS [Lachnospiraceae bacterium]